MVNCLKFLGYACLIIFSCMAAECKFIGSKGILKMVHVIYRHGDLTPLFALSNTSSTDWPEGLGQLTNKGTCQQYELGQWLYHRYQKLLGKQCNSNNIYVRSTDTNRTIESAMANIAGMFAAMDDEIRVCNRHINFQSTLTVHTVGLANDYLLGQPLPSCAAYERAQVKLLNSPKFHKLVNDSQPLFKYLTKSIGFEVNSFKTIFAIYDTLFVMQSHHKKLPEWSKPIFYENSQLEKIVRFIYASLAPPVIMAKLHSGFLLKEILDRCQQKIEHTLVPDLSMYQYSAHDATLANFLNTLGLYTEQSKPPAYTASILFELREFNDEAYYVEMYYKNSTQISTASPIYIPNCGYSCPLEKMYQLYDSVIPKNDFQTECY